ncbi:monoxygenase, putative [Talaromyces stipitatus ATCC 10500]|uniref:Monoxygenase, putative n=1 Tax=Talaromyces stipitatus (strain ATCC 10500 / CBS 375.48 / QM 6759 / NRRL 1006) TaxID=441959 RepID=B8LXY6_TALSN|nr:monooxygenase, putative [Talaromyces stipitatus ATCC 10500]EED22801.1 monoxygenase, putative [Talaromyces stipitatus ATCC 10500]
MTSTESSPLPPRGSPIGISALVVGAGVAGLLAALELWRQGIDVQIIDRAPSRLTGGDGFSISYNIIRSFRNWPYMAKKNEEITFHPYLAWHNIKGERVSGPIKVEIGDKDGEVNQGQEGGPSEQLYRHSRPKFHLMLGEQLEMTGMKVQYGKRAIRYIDADPDQNNKASVELDTGDIMEADIVIAADGIGSHSTKVTLGHEVPARSTGLAIYRAAFSLEIALSDPEIVERFKLLPDGSPVAELWLGQVFHISHVKFFQSCLNSVDNIFIQASRKALESWSRSIPPQQVIDDTTSKLEGWPDYANRVILMTPKDKLIDFELVWRDPQRVWTSNSGRIVQIGDAAHTFLPTSGNGANQGMEDAISLAKCLRIAGKDNIAEATRVHTKLRFERVSCLQKVGIYNQATQYGQRGDDNQLTGELKPMPKYLRALMAPWVVEHDPEEYAAEKYHEALAALKNGTPFQNTNIPRGHVYKPWNFEELLKVVEDEGEVELGGEWYD